MNPYESCIKRIQTMSFVRAVSKKTMGFKIPEGIVLSDKSQVKIWYIRYNVLYIGFTDKEREMLTIEAGFETDEDVTETQVITKENRDEHGDLEYWFDEDEED